MKFQNVIIVLLAILAIVFGIVWVNASKANRVLKESNRELNELYENSARTIGEIQANLESLDQDLSGQLFTQSEIPGGSPEERRERLLATISTMRQQIETDKKKIATLEGQLANSRTQLSGVQNMVARLRASIEEKERMMDELQEQMVTLTDTISDERRLTQAEIALQEQIILKQDQAMQQAEYMESFIYYVVGTRKQLIDSKVIDRKGGLLGIGRVSTVQRNLKLANFHEINLMNQNEIRFPVTKKAYSILSNHLASTYEVKQEGGEYVLKVLDPENFRKQKFLVIELL